MTLADWVEQSGDNIESEVKKIVSILGYDSISSFHKIVVSDYEMTEQSLKELNTNLGGCFLINPIFNLDFISPIIPNNNSIEPMLLVNPGFYKMDKPIIVRGLTYCLNYLDWIIRFRNEKRNSSFDQNFVLFAEFNAEYQSYTRYIDEVIYNSGQLNRDSIKERFNELLRKNNKLNILQMTYIDFIAKDLAIQLFNNELWTNDLIDQENSKLIKIKLGNLGEELKSFFSSPRTYNQSINCLNDLTAIIKSSIHRTMDDLNQSSQALQQGYFDLAIELCERSQNIFRDIGETEDLATCLYNLHSAYSAKKDLENAEKVYQEALNLYEKLNDHIGILYLRYNSLYLNITNYSKAVKEFKAIVKTIENNNLLHLNDNNQELLQLVKNTLNTSVYLKGVDDFDLYLSRLTELFESVG